MTNSEYSNLIRKKLLESNQAYISAMERKLTFGDKDSVFVFLKKKYKDIAKECNKLFADYEKIYLKNIKRYEAEKLFTEEDKKRYYNVIEKEKTCQ
jgi:uncharacterized protein (DUF849 family)